MPPAASTGPYTYQTLPQVQLLQGRVNTGGSPESSGPDAPNALSVLTLTEAPLGGERRQESLFQRRLQEKKRQSQLRRKQAAAPAAAPTPAPEPPPPIEQVAVAAGVLLRRQETHSSGGPPSAGTAAALDLHRGARSAHGRLPSHASAAHSEAAPAQKPQPAFESRPVSTSSPSKDTSDLPRCYADPCLAPVARQPATPPPPNVPNILSLIQNVSNERLDDARKVSEGRDQYEQLLVEQRRKSEALMSGTGGTTKSGSGSSFGGEAARAQQAADGSPQNQPVRVSICLTARAVCGSTVDASDQQLSPRSRGASPLGSPQVSARTAPSVSPCSERGSDRPPPLRHDSHRRLNGLLERSLSGGGPPTLPVGALATDAEIAAGKAHTGPAPNSRGNSGMDVLREAPLAASSTALANPAANGAPRRPAPVPGHRRRRSDGSAPPLGSRATSPERPVRQPHAAAPPPAPHQPPYPRGTPRSQASSSEPERMAARADDVSEGEVVSNAASESEGGQRGRRSASRKRRKIRLRRQAGKEMRIRVCVRKRPLDAAGPEGGEDVVDVGSASVTVSEVKERVDLSKYTEPHCFKFDECFSEQDRNQQVYERAARPLVDTFFEGGRVSVFAYGQTGSGKTHTMLGHHGEEGLFALAAQDIFARLGPTRQVSASFYEIYCNTVYDLLNERKVLFVREDAQHRINICGLSEHPVTEAEELLKLMSIADTQRSSGATSANELSSRSHAILCLSMIDSVDPSCDAVFKFIDLAGSERGADTADRDRKTQIEGAEINKSLLALKECIRALDLGHQHIKFRGSKLTEVLRDSFEGNCRTVMIATVSPSSTNCDHTLNTLRYAHRVKGLPIKSLVPSSARQVPPRQRLLPDKDTPVDTPSEEGLNPLLAPLRLQRKRRAAQRQVSRPRAKSMPSRGLRRDPDSGAPSARVAPQPSAHGVDVQSSDEAEELVALGLPVESADRVRRILGVRRDVHRQRVAVLRAQVATLTKELRDRERAHVQEIAMCKMVKKMDEQRVTLLEEHNRELQRKIQLLTN